VSIGFLIGHAQFAQVLGQFTEVSGEFSYDSETQTLHSGTVEVRATSVFTGHQERDNHVRDDDFLATEDHPLIRFEATDYSPTSKTQGVLSGELSLRGKTRPLSLDLTLNRRGDHPIGGADTLGGSARGHIFRSEFGMEYALEGELVSDKVALIIEFEAIREEG
jgi:Uncharacterized conserved protein